MDIPTNPKSSKPETIFLQALLTVFKTLINFIGELSKKVLNSKKWYERFMKRTN